MRAHLTAIANVACLVVAGCGQASQLPTGRATRITSAEGVISLAVPPGWDDVSGRLATRASTKQDILFAVGPIDQSTWNVWAESGPGNAQVGTSDQVGDTIPLSIAGQSVYGESGNDAGRTGLVASFYHDALGRNSGFWVGCSNDVPRDTCVAVLDSWRWETPNTSGGALPAALGAGGAVALASGALVLVAVRRRRMTTRP